MTRLLTCVIVAAISALVTGAPQTPVRPTPPVQVPTVPTIQPQKPAQPSPNQPPPVFRGRTEIVALDIVVIDKNRQPVRGLTADDFTITEDGSPQRIVNFDAVDLPDPEVPPAKWMVSVTPDVSTNSINDSRLFVMVMDDATMGN